jgi:glycosyltransferase involved in cell wall biosynthesis
MNMPEVKKKIVWLAHEANRSGANIALLEYVDALKDVYDFHIILPHEGNMSEALQQKEISYSVIHQYGWVGNLRWKNLIKSLKIIIRSRIAIRKTKQLIRKEKAGLVFTNTLVPFVAAHAAHSMQIPHVWWIHEFGEEDFGFSIGWGKQARAYEKMQQWSRLIICNSKAVAKKFQQLMPAARMYHAYQPVSWKGNNSTEKKLAKFLVFGQISPSKGHREILQALAVNKQKNISSGGLHIKGPCENKEYLEELKQMVLENHLQDEVKIVSDYFVAEELMPMYDVLIVASRSEAFGRVIVEAIKAGLKVVVKNSGGAPELLNETNGLLYSSEEELGLILSGIKKLPEGPSSMNYIEEKEIEKLKNLLKELL